MKKNPKTSLIKRILINIATAFIVVVLFAIIFIVSELRKPTLTFFLELGLVFALIVTMKVMWYEYSEEKVLFSDELMSKKDDYFDFIDNNITDSNDLEVYLKILNEENRQHYIKNHIGSRTADKLAKKTFWICLFHWNYIKKTKEEIGELRYDKLYFRILRKADKIKPITSEEIIAMSDSELLYDSKNHAREKKILWQSMSTLFSICLTTGFAIVGIKEILINWANAFRFATYLGSILWTIIITTFKAERITRYETLDHISRLRFIADKYLAYKEGKEDNNDGV